MKQRPWSLKEEALALRIRALLLISTVLRGLQTMFAIAAFLFGQARVRVLDAAEHDVNALNLLRAE